MLLDGCLVEKWKDQLNKRFKVNTTEEKNANALIEKLNTIVDFSAFNNLYFTYADHLWVLLFSLQCFNTSKNQTAYLYIVI